MPDGEGKGCQPVEENGEPLESEMGGFEDVCAKRFGQDASDERQRRDQQRDDRDGDGIGGGTDEGYVSEKQHGQRYEACGDGPLCSGCGDETVQPFPQS